MNIRELFPFINDLPEILQPFALDIVLVVIAALLIVVLRWVLTWLLLKPLRLLVRRTATDLDDVLIEQLISPVRISTVGLALILTANVFNFGIEVQQIAVAFGRALLIGSLFFALIRAFEAVSVHPELLKQVTGLTIPERLLPFLNTVVKYAIGALGAIFVFQELGFDVAALIASLGVVGIGISLASQNTVGNVFGFAAIVTDNPFKVGDFIKTPNVTGIVETVGARSTRVRQLDQALVTVPNNLLTDAVVLNWSRLEKRRLDVTLSFTYSTSSEQMRAVIEALREMLANAENVDPETVIVHFVEFNSSSLDVRIICQVLLSDWREFTACKESLLLEIMGIVEEHGVSFAFPSRSLYLEESSGLTQLDGQAERLPKRDSRENPAIDDSSSGVSEAFAPEDEPRNT